MERPYILFCAGEDSGDAIGESLVKTVLAEGRFNAVGAGGMRMQAAGMQAIVDYEDLPVSGFGDVLPRYFKLRRHFQALCEALRSEKCLGLVAVDYPGFNMKLVRLAGMLKKPSLYVAPPQVWAWKAKRAKELAQNTFAKLAVFFDFEERVYKEAGCNVVRVQHPFVDSKGLGADPTSQDTLSSPVCPRSSKILLLPGSRKSQALRNLPIYLDTVKDIQDVVVIAARQELVPAFEKFGVQVAVAPQNVQERAALYGSAKYAITAPGTATLELALSGCPMLVCTKPDLLTYCLGWLFIKTKYFALPNIILGKQVYPEYILGPFQQSLSRLDWKFPFKNARVHGPETCGLKPESSNLYAKLSVGQTLEQLALEFLRQFV